MKAHDTVKKLMQKFMGAIINLTNNRLCRYNYYG